MRFNTGIAAMMEFVNGAYKWEDRPKAALEQFVLLLAPYAPHLAEEMWQVCCFISCYSHLRDSETLEEGVLDVPLLLLQGSAAACPACVHHCVVMRPMQQACLCTSAHFC